MSLLSVIVMMSSQLVMESSIDAKYKPVSKQLHSILESEWERTLKDNSTFASRLGDHRFNTRWTDLSVDTIKDRPVNR